MKRIVVVTGTRAEYGILYPALKAIAAQPDLELLLVATGMHLSREFGYTIDDIKRDGFTIAASVDMLLASDTPTAMAKSIGIGISGIAQAFEHLQPDAIVVLGDRTEPLAAAIAGAYMNIPVAHIHGGDNARAGLDEYSRHAITRMAHIHFPSTPEHADRLVRVGEDPWRIHMVGPLGIYAMSKENLIPKHLLCKQLGLLPDKPILLVIQHPVTTQVGKAAEQLRETLDALVELKEQTVLIYPNADAGGRSMIDVIKRYEHYSFIKTFKSLPYLTFVSLLKSADVMVGNSSSGIVESPLFGVPAVNIGIRQEGRQRGGNVINAPHSKAEIGSAIKKALSTEFRKSLCNAENPFNFAVKGPAIITDVLSKLEATPELFQKRLTY